MALSEATNLLMWSDRNTVAYRLPRVVSAGDRPDAQNFNAKFSRLWVANSMHYRAVPIWRKGGVPPG